MHDQIHIICKVQSAKVRLIGASNDANLIRQLSSIQPHRRAMSTKPAGNGDSLQGEGGQVMEHQGCLINFHFRECFRVQSHYTVYTSWWRFTDRSLSKNWAMRNSCLIGLAWSLALLSRTVVCLCTRVTCHLAASHTTKPTDRYCLLLWYCLSLLQRLTDMIRYLPTLKLVKIERQGILINSLRSTNLLWYTRALCRPMVPGINCEPQTLESA